VVVRFGLVEEAAEIVRVSVGYNSRLEVLLRNSPVVLQDEHSEGSAQDLVAAL